MYSITMYFTGTKLVCSELGPKVYIYFQLPHTDLSASQCRFSLLCSAQPSRTGVFLSALSFCPAWLSHLCQGPTPAQQVNQCHPMPTVRQRGKYNADFGALELFKCHAERSVFYMRICIQRVERGGRDWQDNKACLNMCWGLVFTYLKEHNASVCRQNNTVKSKYFPKNISIQQKRR